MLKLILVALAMGLSLAFFGWVRGSFLLILASSGLLPRGIETFATSDSGTGDIAPINLTITTFILAPVVCFIVMGGDGKRKLNLEPAYFLGVLGMLFLSLLVWPGSVAGWEALLVIGAATLAWSVGRGLGADLFADPRNSRFVARTLFFLVGFQFLVECLQFARFSLPHWLVHQGRLEVAIEGRVFGTLGHPANLSKMFVLVAVLLLAVVSVRDASTRKWAGAALIILIPATAMTVSRANTIALLVLLVLWTLMATSGLAKSLRTLIVLGLGAGLVVFFGEFERRFVADPTGGARPELLSAGITQLQRTPWVGTGPNQYIDTVSKFSADTALGYPVHNTFLFVACSVGIPLAILFFIPHGKLVRLAWRARRISEAATVILMSIPGMLVIMLTGWAMFSQFSIVTWFFISGILLKRIESEIAAPEDRTDTRLPETPRGDNLSALGPSTTT